MSINKKELIEKPSLIDKYFLVQSHIPNDEIEKFCLDFFSQTFRICFPQITAKLKNTLVSICILIRLSDLIRF
jgi:hypothetical protein